jgi:hypothetical protein
VNKTQLCGHQMTTHDAIFAMAVVAVVYLPFVAMSILRGADLPLNFHPAAARASANVTPFGAVSVPA